MTASSANIEEQVRAYIENKLAHDEEQEFLISLASSEKLSNALKTELTITRGLAGLLLATTVPPEYDVSLFKRLGIYNEVKNEDGALNIEKKVRLGYLPLWSLGFVLCGFSFTTGYFLRGLWDKPVTENIPSEQFQQPNAGQSHEPSSLTLAQDSLLNKQTGLKEKVVKKESRLAEGRDTIKNIRKAKGKSATDSTNPPSVKLNFKYLPMPAKSGKDSSSHNNKIQQDSTPAQKQ